MLQQMLADMSDSISQGLPAVFLNLNFPKINLEQNSMHLIALKHAEKNITLNNNVFTDWPAFLSSEILL
jgi:hypothetical protein